MSSSCAAIALADCDLRNQTGHDPTQNPIHTTIALCVGVVSVGHLTVQFTTSSNDKDFAANVLKVIRARNTKRSLSRTWRVRYQKPAAVH